MFWLCSVQFGKEHIELLADNVLYKSHFIIIIIITIIIIINIIIVIVIVIIIIIRCVGNC